MLVARASVRTGRVRPNACGLRCARALSHAPPLTMRFTSPELSATVVQVPAFSDNYIYLAELREEGPSNNNSGNSNTVRVCVDPGDAEPVLEVAQQLGWRLDFVLNTHHHHDHTGGNDAIVRAHGAALVAPTRNIPRVDHEAGEEVGMNGVGGLLQRHVRVFATPGHTLDHIAFYLPSPGLLFCGDTLFAMGCGRLFEGTAQQMHRSLSKLAALPPSTHIFPAHEYTQANAKFARHVDPQNDALKERADKVDKLRSQNVPTVPCTLGEELATNPFLRASDPALQQHAHKHSGVALGDHVGVFAHLRKLKDGF